MKKRKIQKNMLRMTSSTTLRTLLHYTLCKAKKKKKVCKVVRCADDAIKKIFPKSFKQNAGPSEDSQSILLIILYFREETSNPPSPLSPLPPTPLILFSNNQVMPSICDLYKTLPQLPTNFFFVRCCFRQGKKAHLTLPLV